MPESGNAQVKRVGSFPKVTEHSLLGREEAPQLGKPWSKQERKWLTEENRQAPLSLSLVTNASQLRQSNSNPHYPKPSLSWPSRSADPHGGKTVNYVSSNWVASTVEVAKINKLVNKKKPNLRGMQMTS